MSRLCGITLPHYLHVEQFALSLSYGICFYVWQSKYSFVDTLEMPSQCLIIVCTRMPL